jgi:23S rRNA pseudouridine1911/1915/1917 synthase
MYGFLCSGAEPADVCDESTLKWTMQSGSSPQPRYTECMGDTWVVGADAERMRLDKYLAAAERLGSRGRAATALQRGKVFLNDREVGPAQAGVSLAPGDRVRIWMDRPGSATPRHGASPRRVGASRGGFEIIFDDSLLLVVNKPAGLLTVPLPRKPDEASVYAYLVEHFRSRRRSPYVVHRIDRDTSGLVVFAKDASTQQALKAQFIRREPERVYVAVVAGHPSPPEGTWRDRLLWNRVSLVQQEADQHDPRGVDAVSRYRVTESLPGTSVLEVRLHTGKRNQIRIQAALRGHPLVGEQRYTGPPGSSEHAAAAVTFRRQALHAWRLGFAHPGDGRPLEFEAPLPEDMTSLIRGLRRLARAL